MKIKSCCFIGHRKIDITEDLKLSVKTYIENLIMNQNVKFFLVGSRSDFNSLCHSIVQELKTKYTDIKLIAYNCKSEISFLESEKEKWEKIVSKKENKPINLLCVDEIIEYKSKYESGKASYIERNKIMIDNSDFCIFYYNKNYTPPQRKNSKITLSYYQPNSGTALAFNYAIKAKKIVYNFF